MFTYYVEHLFNLIDLMIICPKLTTGLYAQFILINLRAIAKQLITSYIIHSRPIILIDLSTARPPALVFTIYASPA